MCQTVSALKYLNEIKPAVIHYDLKPGMILPMKRSHSFIAVEIDQELKIPGKEIDAQIKGFLILKEVSWKEKHLTFKHYAYYFI